MKSLLIALLFVALASLSNWLQQRAQAQQQPKPKPPGPRPPRPQPAPSPPEPRGSLESTLERELRRLLGQDIEPPPAPPVMPPARAHLQPPPVATTLRRAARGMAAPASPAPVLLGPAAASALASMGEAGSGYERAQHLHESVAMRLRGIDTQTQEHRGTIPAEALPNPASFLRELKASPGAVRQAFIASLVFGPGKWME